MDKSPYLIRDKPDAQTRADGLMIINRLANSDRKQYLFMRYTEFSGERILDLLRVEYYEGNRENSRFKDSGLHTSSALPAVLEVSCSISSSVADAVPSSLSPFSVLKILFPIDASNNHEDGTRTLDGKYLFDHSYSPTLRLMPPPINLSLYRFALDSGYSPPPNCNSSLPSYCNLFLDTPILFVS